jgi:FKBP-type peptidyl-prolyl cis-trans isomerase 2
MEKGDIVFLEYDAWIVDVSSDKDDLFDTTSEETAKAADMYEEKAVYKARPFIAGVEGYLRGMGEALLEAEVEKEYTLEIPPEQAFGERDPKLVEVHSKAEIMKLPEFRKEKGKEPKEPTPGMDINLKGKMGRITMVTAGRIRVDFNHRLAGKTLKYKYKISGVAKTTEERIKAILSIHYGREDEFKMDVDDKTVKLVLADLCKYDAYWHQVKIRVVSDLREHVGMETIQFIEEYTKRKPTDEEKVDEGEEKAEGAEEKAVEGEGPSSPDTSE